MKIPELSLSPWCMLGPDYDIVFVVRFSFSLFDGRTRCLFALHFRYWPALRSIVFVVYLSSAVLTSSLNASMQHQSVLPNSGILLLLCSGRYSLSKVLDPEKVQRINLLTYFCQ